MQLFSLGIKMKVVHNVIRMSDSQKILVRKSLRTAIAKEPALVHKCVSKLSTMLSPVPFYILQPTTTN